MFLSAGLFAQKQVSTAEAFVKKAESKVENKERASYVSVPGINHQDGEKNLKGCVHTLYLNDSYADGWNGNTISLWVNSVLVLDHVAGMNSSSSETFSCEGGDQIDVVYHEGGSWGYENSWELVDGTGVTLITGDGGDSGTWTQTTTAGACPLNNDATISAIPSPVDGFFPGTTDITITLLNAGLNQMTVCDINYNVYDVTNAINITSGTFNWTGTLNNLVSEDVIVGDFASDFNTSYSITATVVLAGDENSTNDEFVATILSAVPFAPPYTQDFETPTGWTNSTDDDGDWEYTKYIGHGASADHTTGSDYYVGLDDSSPMEDGMFADLITPIFDLTAMTAPAAYFYYQNVDDGATGVADITELHVDIYDGTTWTNDVLVITEEVNAWTEFSVNLTSYGDFAQLRFRGITTSSFYSDPSIDDFEIRELPVNELAVTAITPNWTFANETYYPEIEITNNGTADQTSYDVTIYTADGSYTETFTVNETIVAGGTYIVTALMWANVPAGTYTLTAVVTLAGDENMDNDMMSISLKAVEFENYTEGTIYAFDISDWTSSGLGNHIVNVNTTDATMSDVGVSGVASMFCGDFIYGMFYGIVDNVVYAIANNGFAVEMGAINGLTGASGLAWDVAGDEVYISTVEGLYTVDDNMNAVEVGTYSSTVQMIGIAADLDGNLYGVGLDDNFYTINKATGEETLIGALGIDISFAQDIGYDRTNGILYGTLYLGGGTGGLYTIDVTTGVATQIGVDFGDELGACAIYYDIPTYSVTFTVDDGTTPIDGAMIDINGETYTVTSGTIDIELEEGDTFFMVTADGFDDYYGTYTVTTDPDQLVEIHMTATTYTVTFNVDMNTPIMTGEFVVGIDVVYIAGSMADWNEPGTNPDLEMLDADMDGIYSISFDLTEGNYQYKYFKNAGWDGGEWNGGDDRTYTVTASKSVVNDLWANEYLVTFSVTDGTNPLENADISVNGENVMTAVDGMAYIGLVNDAYNFDVTLAGYEVYSNTVTVMDDNELVEVVLIMTDIDELNSNLSVYPNPSNGKFTVSVNGTFTLQVVDITGKVISTQEITNTEDINLSQAGVYMLKLSNNVETLNYKVIVK